MEPDNNVKSWQISGKSWDFAADYQDLIDTVIERSDRKRLFDPSHLTPDQIARHADTPALQRAWDDYITLWKLTHD